VRARAVFVAFVAATACLLPSVARAAGTSADARAGHEEHDALVFAKHDDAVVTRLRRELSGLGLQPSVIVDDENCASARVAREMIAHSTTAVLCVEEDGITIWALDPATTIAMPREHVSWTASPPSPEDLAIVQAAEAARAQDLSQHAEAKDAAFVTSIAPEIDRLRPPPAPGLVEAAPGAVRAGVGGLGGSSGANSTAEVAVEGRIHRRVSVVVSGDIATSPNVYFHLAQMRTASFEVGIVVPLTAPSSWIVPKVGVSTGVVALNSQSMLVSGRTQTLFSPLVVGTASLSIRIYGPVRLAAGVQLGTATAPMVVRVATAENYNFGLPLYGAMTGLEMQFQ
jgi:hypothetical protein